MAIKKPSFREFAAMAAMQGLLTNKSDNYHIQTERGVLVIPAREAIPALAVEYADALLKELDK
jgi:hypothetical protein